MAILFSAEAVAVVSSQTIAYFGTLLYTCPEFSGNADVAARPLSSFWMDLPCLVVNRLFGSNLTPQAPVTACALTCNAQVVANQSDAFHLLFQGHEPQCGLPASVSVGVGVV